MEEVLNKLAKSKFRSSFHLTEKDLNYIKENGLAKIEEHAYYFVKTRLAPKNIKNDGKQTPYRNHPVFITQHATATCCRRCLLKWHHISKNKELTIEEQCYIVTLIMKWLKKEISQKKIL